MKLTRIPGLLAFAAGTWLTATTHAQSGGRFEMSSSVIGGGGLTSTSTNQRFVLTATAGQPEAAPVLSSGNGRFALEPGFWHGFAAVQTPDAPLLKIRALDGGKVVLSWSSRITGFVLEETPALGASSWTESRTAIVDAGDEKTVTVRSAGLMKCYRLRKP